MRPADTRGFTLIDVAIAAGLLVVIALGTAQLFMIAIHHNLRARRQLSMSLLAARKADDLTVLAAAGASSVSTGGAVDRTVEGFSDVAADAGARYLRRWAVADVPGHAGLLAIVVRVAAADRSVAPGPGYVQIATVCEVHP